MIFPAPGAAGCGRVDQRREMRSPSASIRFEMGRRLSPGSLNMTDLLVRLLARRRRHLPHHVRRRAAPRPVPRAVDHAGHPRAVDGHGAPAPGDFSHPIRVYSATSSASSRSRSTSWRTACADLLREQADKERLEEELRIARKIQMSLLPQGTVTLPGLRIAALCLPAAEVGGDYYDLLPLSPTRMGVLVADVSGKGTSAALYMAELKGLVLSLSRIYDSPGALLGEANRILGREHGPALVHHHDLRGRRHRARHHDVRARRAQPAHPPERAASPACSPRRPRPRAWTAATASRRSSRRRWSRSTPATCSCSSPTACRRR
jgi:hypothetical protein